VRQIGREEATMSETPGPPAAPRPPAGGGPQPQSQASASTPVAIELPASLEAIYSNFALITHSPSEVVIDFARVLPNMPKSRIYARIVLTPLNAKLLLRALTDNLGKFEAQYGEIVVPTHLADQLFKPPKVE
jgi:hypothetical protein